MLKITRAKDSDKITQLQTAAGVFSYTYLVSPRPEDNFNPGTYGTEFIIRDGDTIKALKEYLSQVITEAKTEIWGGKIPANLHLPLKTGDEEVDIEKDAYVLKTASKRQPKLFILNPTTGNAHEIEDEEELSEIYAGMIGEVIIKFSAYVYNSINGVKCYINAACKTADGEPLANRASYKDAFSLSTEFDVNGSTDKAEEQAEPEAVEKPTVKPAAVKPTVKLTEKPVAKPVVKPAVQEKEPTLDDLLAPKAGKAKVEETRQLTIDDLIK
jgi:hypothetical protein